MIPRPNIYDLEPVCDVNRQEKYSIIGKRQTGPRQGPGLHVLG